MPILDNGCSKYPKRKIVKILENETVIYGNPADRFILDCNHFCWYCYGEGFPRHSIGDMIPCRICFIEQTK